MTTPAKKRPNTGSFQPGRSGNPAGRPAGVPNKTTAIVKAGILAAYEGIGGDKAFQEWAKANPSEFYTKIVVRLLPAEMHVSDAEGQPLIPPGTAFAFVVSQIPGAENRT